jgi:hypothetical protein
LPPSDQVLEVDDGLELGIVLDAKPATDSAQIINTKDVVEDGGNIQPRSPLEEFANRIPRRATTEEELARYELSQCSSVQLTHRWMPESIYTVAGQSREETPVVDEQIDLRLTIEKSENVYLWKYREVRTQDAAGRFQIERIQLNHQAELNDAKIRSMTETLGKDGPSAQLVLERLTTRLQLIAEFIRTCQPSITALEPEDQASAGGGDPEDRLSMAVSRILDVANGWYLPMPGRHPIIAESNLDSATSYTAEFSVDKAKMSSSSCFRTFEPFMRVAGMRVHFQAGYPKAASDRGTSVGEADQGSTRAVVAELQNVNHLKMPGVDLQLIVRGYADSVGMTGSNRRLARTRCNWLRGIIEESIDTGEVELLEADYGDLYARKQNGAGVEDERHRLVTLEVIAI